MSSSRQKIKKQVKQHIPKDWLCDLRIAYRITMEAFNDIKRTGIMNLVIITTMAAILTIFGALFRTTISMSQFAHELGNVLEISVYLKSDTQPSLVADKIVKLQHVSKVKIIPKEVSWKSLRKEIDLPNITNPLPDTLHVKVDKPANISAVLNQIKTVSEVEDTGYAEDLAKKLAPILKMPYGELLNLLKKPGPVITIKKDIDKNTAKELAKLHLREISMGKKNTRTYPQGTLAAHVLGYYNFDADIANGVEYTAKDKLEHVEHAVRYQRTRDGKIIYDFMTDPVATTTNPKGQDITLTIDAAIQHVCEKELQKMIDEKEALRGTVIVMNPKNGEILAYAVYPTYDPNNYRKASELQIKNWTLTDVFPPGSTFKIITVASAMDLGKINEHTQILDTGKTSIGKWEIKNYDYNVHPYPGMISLEYLFEHSSNIGSINVAKTMTSKEFYDMLK